MAAFMCFALHRNLFKSRISENILIRAAFPISVIQERCFAARRGRRDALKAKQKANKLEKMQVKKPTGPGFMKMDSSRLHNRNLNVDKWLKSPPANDVWCTNYHKKQGFNLSQALDMHRQTLHPTMLNNSDALIYTTIEVNMKQSKKDKYLEPFTSVVGYPHSFVFREEKKVLAFCSQPEDIEAALSSGAIAAGGEELIEKFKAGDFGISDFDYVVAHNNILPDLLVIKTQLKKQYPNKALGNIGTDIGSLVKLFKNGLSFAAQRDTVDASYGWVDVVFGRLGMSNEELEENFYRIIEIIEQFRPKNVTETFIKDVMIWAPPSPEKFHVFFWKNLKGYDEKIHNNKYTIIGQSHYVESPVEVNSSL